MKKTVEELLQRPYWIVDILPFQVPADSPGQYFAVEKYYLQDDRLEMIKQKHIDLVLKLNCCMDISISDEAVIDPPPDPQLLELIRQIACGEGLYVWRPAV